MELIGFDESDCRRIPLERIVEVWRGNHRKLLDHVMSVHFPFFGLHGTSEEGYQGIVRNRGSNNVYIATFYKKQRDEFWLYQFYAMFAYVSDFALHPHIGTRPGKVLVFNFGDDNRTFSSSNLPGCGGLFPLTSDTREEAEYFERLKNPNNLLWKVSLGFSIDHSPYSGPMEISKTRAKTDMNDISQYAKYLALKRIDAQFDLMSVIRLLGSN